MTKWWEALLDIIYPPCCPICRKPVDSHGAICLKCLSRIFAVREINLRYRGIKFLDSCHVLCDYTAGARALIHGIKFRQASQFAHHLGILLEERLNAKIIAGIDIAVPVPLHTARLAERGYNQSELIFRRWAENHGLHWHEALSRIRSTEPQWRLQPQDRRKNIKGAFSVTRPEIIKNKTILLVDDIVTSGATLDECAKMLKRSGAAKVTALVLAGGTGR